MTFEALHYSVHPFIEKCTGLHLHSWTFKNPVVENYNSFQIREFQLVEISTEFNNL